MKKCLIIALLGGSAVVCAAQTNRFPPINLYTGDPTGNACTANLIQQSSTTGLIYTCQSGTMKAGGASGSGTVSGQTNGKIPLATGATTVGAPSHLDDGLTTPATITATEPFAGSSAAFSGNVNANASIPSVSPTADIRARGAVIDGATPIDTALTGSVNVCNAANGNACQVLLPCAGPNGCVIDNGSTVLPVAPGGRNVELDIQGFVHLNSTLYIPSQYSIKCKGGAGGGQFQSIGSTCQIQGPPVKGTMGTATVTVGTPTTFTPAFTIGSSSNFHVNSAISVAGVQTCTADASRDSTIAYHQPNTVFTVSSCTNSSGTTETVRIPVGTTVKVTCPGDSSFNQNQTLVNGQDWPASTISVYEAGGTATTTGCTLIGYDDFSYETVRVEAVAGGTMTATFAHPHDASDLWGMVGVSTSNPALHSNISFEGVQFANAFGMQLWFDNTSTINMTGVYAFPQPYMASGGVENDGSWWGQWNSVQLFAGNSIFTCTPGTMTNCTTPAYPWGLRCSQDSTRRDGIGCGQIGIRDATIIGGIKFDGNGMTNSNGSGLVMVLSNYLAEQSYEGMVLVDNSHSLGGDVRIYADVLTESDSFYQNRQHYFAATDCCLNNAYATMGALSFNGASIKLTNKYWMGGIHTNGVGGTQNTLPNPTATAPHTTTGVLSDGNTVIANIRGSGANFSPSLIPFTTLPVTAAPTCATCLTVTGPDKVANSAVEVRTAAGPTNVILQVASASLATYPGDWIVYGAWIAPGALQTNVVPGSAFGPNSLLNLTTTGTDTFQGGIGVYSPTGPSNFILSGVLLPMVNDTWQPGINVATIITGQSTPHTVKLSVESGSSAQGVGSGNQYYDWWWALIPGPNNPSYDGITTRQEVMRYLRENVHGYVPPSVPAGGGILAVNPNHKFFWESGVNLYDAGSGVLKTDGGFNAVGGLQANGVAVPTVSGNNTFTGSNTFTTGTQDFHASAHTLPAKSGTIASLPATCTVGEEYFATDATAGSNKYGCTSTNTWTVLGGGGTGVVTTVPLWLQFLGDGSESAPSCGAGCNVNGEHWFASVNVPAGQVMSVNSSIGLVIRSTGTCTIAGTISASANGSGSGITGVSNLGSTGGGGGFGAANGTAGSLSGASQSGGSAGTTGVTGGAGSAALAQIQKLFLGGGGYGMALASAGAVSTGQVGGSSGGGGGSSGGAGGKGGGLVVFDCATVNFTGTIDASGVAGGAGGANTGGGGGGAGGIVILRSPAMTNSGTINVTHGNGGAIGTGTSTAGGNGADGWSKVFSN